MKQNINGTPFTIDFVLNKLHEAGVNGGCTVQNLSNFDAHGITNGSAFMSEIYRLTFHWKNPDTEPKSLILKVPGTANSTKFQNNVNNDTGEKHIDTSEASAFLEVAHDREILFYTHFPKYDKELKLPEFYYGYEFRLSHNQGIIIMEDLTPTGVTVPMLPGFNDTQMCAMMDELARIHTASWKHRNWVELFGMRQEDPAPYVNNIRTMCKLLKKIKPEWFSELVDELLPHMTVDEMKSSQYSEEKYGFPSSVVHGDLWAPNILWERDENGAATEKVRAIIDWQIIHSGNPCEDIGRLLNLNVSSEYRRKNTNRLLKRYHNKITELFDGKPPCSFEQIIEAYKGAMYSVVLFTTFGAPVYYEMESVVGTKADPHRAQNRLELLDRVRTFYEDALNTWRKENIQPYPLK